MNDEATDIGANVEQPGQPGSTAVSIFAQESSAGDFPVLKAFQQYLDAEQSKARKRMFNLAIFFVILLVIVVLAFAVIMATVLNGSQRNTDEASARIQSMQDKMLELALQQRAQPVQPSVVNVQQPVPVPAPQTSSAELKALQAEVLSLRAQVAAAQSAQSSVSQGLSQGISPTSVLPQTQPTVSTAQQQPAVASVPAVDSTTLELQRVKAELAVEREMAKRRAQEEQKRAEEQRHQEEVERYRRRLYPEYYAKQDALQKGGQPSAVQVPVALPPPPSPTKVSVPPSQVPASVAPSVVSTPAVQVPPSAIRPTTPAVSVPSVPVQVPRPASVVPPTEKANAPAVQVPAVPAPAAQPVVAPEPVAPVSLKTDKPISYFGDEEDAELLEMAKNLNAARLKAPSTPQSVVEGQPVAQQPIAQGENITQTQPADKSQGKKVEMLTIGTGPTGGIPFLVELPVGK